GVPTVQRPRDETGSRCVVCKHCKAGAAPATVSERHERRTPLCDAREGAVRGERNHRPPLASPETGLDDSWWLAVGEAGPRSSVRRSVSALRAAASPSGHAAVRGCAAKENENEDEEDLAGQLAAGLRHRRRRHRAGPGRAE